MPVAQDIKPVGGLRQKTQVKILDIRRPGGQGEPGCVTHPDLALCQQGAGRLIPGQGFPPFRQQNKGVIHRSVPAGEHQTGRVSQEEGNPGRHQLFRHVPFPVGGPGLLANPDPERVPAEDLLTDQPDLFLDPARQAVEGKASPGPPAGQLRRQAVHLRPQPLDGQGCHRQRDGLVPGLERPGHLTGGGQVRHQGPGPMAGEGLIGGSQPGHGGIGPGAAGPVEAAPAAGAPPGAIHLAVLAQTTAEFGILQHRQVG